VLAPRFARCQDPLRLRRLYLALVGGITTEFALLAACAWVWPGGFLWLLGQQYAGLHRECGWVITAGCLGQLGAIMWTLNNSRAWIRIQAPAFIVSVLAVQAAAAVLLDLHRMDDVLLFNLLTAVAPLPIYLADALLGLRRARLLNDSYFPKQLAC